VRLADTTKPQAGTGDDTGDRGFWEPTGVWCSHDRLGSAAPRIATSSGRSRRPLEEAATWWLDVPETDSEAKKKSNRPYRMTPWNNQVQFIAFRDEVTAR